MQTSIKKETVEREQAEVIKIVPHLNTFEDKKTGVQTVAFTFQFPSGANGIVSITKLKKGKWIVDEDLDEIYIKFK